MIVMSPEDFKRRAALYNHLIALGDKWNAQEDIYNALAEYYPPIDRRNFHNSTARVKMSADIRAINQSDIFEKIIISNKNGVKIASHNEASEYVSSRLNSASILMRDVAILRGKMRSNGQSDFSGNTVSTYLKKQGG